MIGFILFTPMFLAWWIVLGLAEANYKITKEPN